MAVGLSAAATIAVVLLFTGRLMRLRRTPADHSLRALTMCMGAFLLVEPMPMWLDGASPISTTFATAPNAAVAFVERSVHATALVSLMLFFCYSAFPTERAHVVARREILSGLVVIAAMGALWVVSLRQTTSPLAGIPVWAGVLSGTYTAVMMTRGGRWSARYSREVAERMRPGPRIGASGLWLYGFGVAVASALPLFGLVGTQWTLPVDALVDGARLLFVLGLLYPILLARVDGARMWWWHWRCFRDLDQLRQQLQVAFPGGKRQRPRRWVRPAPWRVHRRHWRRLVEVRDGLVRLGPHLHDLGASPETSFERQAADLDAALARLHAAVTPNSTNAVPLGIDESAESGDALARLARAHRAHQRGRTEYHRTAQYSR